MGTSIPMIEKHYSHLTPRLRKDMLTGKRYELSDEEYRKQFDVGSLTLDRSAIGNPSENPDLGDAELTEDPIGSDTLENNDLLVSTQRSGGSEVEHTRSAAEKAFDLFEAGKLSEAGLLASLGTNRKDYTPDNATTRRALMALEKDRLSEGALIKIMG